MLVIPGSAIRLPAEAIETHPTRCPAAWQGEMMTVRLLRSIDALRLAPGHSSLLGDWFALGASAGSPQQFAAEHALPRRGNVAHAPVTQSAVWTLQRGTLLNIGRCGPLFDYPGGGYQAEFVEGPLPVIRTAAAV